MIQLKLFLLIVLAHGASCMIVGRDGFVIRTKEWTHVVGKNVEEAKRIVKEDLPSIEFVVVSDETYPFIPSEGYLNQVMLGVSSTGEVKYPAKYYGYVPDFTFLQNSVGKPYAEVVESIKEHLPSCKIVVVKNGVNVYTCCQRDFFDHVKLEVDANGLLLHLPVFVPNKLE